MIWAFLLNNPLARLLGKVAAVALAVVTFGAWQRRQGAQAAKADHIEAEAEAYRDTIERVTDEKPSNDTTDRLRERMRQRAKR